jgi:hypothetical protein
LTGRREGARVAAQRVFHHSELRLKKSKLSFPRKRESSGMATCAALGPRFRGDDSQGVAVSRQNRFEYKAGLRCFCLGAGAQNAAAGR